VTRNANQAKEVTLTFGSLVNAQFMPGDELSVRILAKVADSGGHNNATGVRLYYDATTRPARFGTTFAPVNTAPTANAGADQTGGVGQTIQLDGSGSSDINGDPLTYQWTLTAKPSGSGAALLNPTTVHPSLTLDKPGNYTGQLIVNDGTVNSAPDTVVISTVNSAPVANAGPDQTGVVAQTIQLNGSGSSDVDGDLLTYQWTLTGWPAGSNATVTNPTSVTPTVTLDKPGNYTGQLVVNDGTVNSAPDTVVISTMNSAPVAHAGPDQTHFVGDTAQLDGSGSSDVDGDPLTYEWSLTAVPPGSTAALSDPTVVAPTFVLDRPGTYVAQLLVHDGTVNSAPDTVTISTVNSRPLAQAGPDQSALVGTRVYLDGSGSSDVDGDPLIYQWSVTARPTGSTATLDNPTTVTPSFLVDKPGTYTVQLMVNDGTADSDL
jgi:PKD domain-containing protein/K319-like protein